MARMMAEVRRYLAFWYTPRMRGRECQRCGRFYFTAIRPTSSLCVDCQVQEDALERKPASAWDEGERRGSQR